MKEDNRLKLSVFVSGQPTQKWGIKPGYLTLNSKIIPQMPLTDTKIKNAKPKEKPYKLFDGDGLFVLVQPNGKKFWRMKFFFFGKEKLLSFGQYPEISLAEAREKRQEAKKLLSNGYNPSAVKRRGRLTKSAAGRSFGEIAAEWQEYMKPRWTPKYALNVEFRVKNNLLPDLGGMDIAEIEPLMLLDSLRKIEERGAHDLAFRVKQISRMIFTYAIATGRATRNPANDLSGILKSPEKRNFSFLLEGEMPEFLRALERFEGSLQTKLAIRLLLYTCCRTTEIRGAEWREIDLTKEIWVIPEERMKMGRKHIVPLPRQALHILRELLPLTGNSRFLFPHISNPKKFMSENTMLYALYRMGYHTKATIHGFRHTASTIMHERINEHGCHSAVIERQLAHVDQNKIRGTYNHAEYLENRRVLTQWWADHLDSLVGS